MIGEIIFTGQAVVKETAVGSMEGHNEFVVCHACGNESDLIGLRSNAWYDKHQDGGKYVHRKCLSQQRLNELSQME